MYQNKTKTSLKTTPKTTATRASTFELPLWIQCQEQLFYATRAIYSVQGLN